MALTILEGSTFCICDEHGDIDRQAHGFFADDTRFLSRLCLTVNGAAPLMLSSGKVEYFSAAFYLRNPPAGGLPHDTVSIIRHRFVGGLLQRNNSATTKSTRRGDETFRLCVLNAIAQCLGGEAAEDN